MKRLFASAALATILGTVALAALPTLASAFCLPFFVETTGTPRDGTYTVIDQQTGMKVHLTGYKVTWQDDFGGHNEVLAYPTSVFTTLPPDIAGSCVVGTLNNVSTQTAENIGGVLQWAQTYHVNNNQMAAGDLDTLMTLLPGTLKTSKRHPDTKMLEALAGLQSDPPPPIDSVPNTITLTNVANNFTVTFILASYQ